MMKKLKITVISLLFLGSILCNKEGIIAFWQLHKGYWTGAKFDYYSGRISPPYHAYKFDVLKKTESFQVFKDTLLLPSSESEFSITWGNKIKTSWGTLPIIDIKRDTIVYAYEEPFHLHQDTATFEVSNVEKHWEIRYLTRIKKPAFGKSSPSIRY